MVQDMDEHLLQGGGVFEITDYTTASDWERFIANIEEILTEWGLHKESNNNQTYLELPKGFISRGIWHEKHETVKYGNITFQLKFQYLNDSELTAKSKEQLDKKHDAKVEVKLKETDSTDLANEDNESLDSLNSKESLKETKDKTFAINELPEDVPECIQDINSTSNDFASKAHCLVRWYNLRKFIVLIPKGDTIVSEDRVKLVLSSASIALSNIDCHLPIFVQIHNPKNHFYQGISEHLNIRTMYEMIFLRRNLKQYSYLSELISMFREKACCSLSDPISVTARLNYCLENFELFIDEKDSFQGNEHDDDDVYYQKTKESNSETVRSTKPRPQDMRSGATFDQVVEALKDCLPHPYRILNFIHVAAIWPPVSDKVITDNQAHSDLDPAEAPIWTMRCVTSDNCNMKIVHETQAVFDLLSSAIDYAYDKLDAETAFSDSDKETLRTECLKLSYDLATQPEVLLSESSSDNLRKLVALLFHRAAELSPDIDALDQIAGQLKKKPSLAEIYRNFNRKQKPSVKEFIIRSQVSRPFNPNSTPALPQRLFCTICDQEFRLCGAFSELCN